MQIQSLKRNLCPLFVCIVFESIQPLCAQYLRNNSGVDSLVRRAQRAARGAEGLGFLADCVSVSLPSVCRSLWWVTQAIKDSWKLFEEIFYRNVIRRLDFQETLELGQFFFSQIARPVDHSSMIYSCLNPLLPC